MKLKDIYDTNDRLVLENCNLCPRNCRVDRFSGADGYCATDAGWNVSSVCIHKGEEPVIRGLDGICNIFFSGCNLHCIFCQNHEISRQRSSDFNREGDFQKIVDRIENILQKGIEAVGFVSPSHVVPQVKAIINGLNARGLKPITVYNTNSYDKVETIRSLSGLIDVYLPDYKYFNTDIALKYSDAVDYPEIALKAIREMYYQKGSSLIINDNGIAENGLLIRHLVLPGHTDDSKEVLRSIAEELSPGVHLSLMSQFHPTATVKSHAMINRSLYREEYDEVVEEMEKLGFRNGWVQDMDSFENYLPDFSKENPFD